MIRHRQTFRHGEAGSTMVEFALVFPILVALIFLVIDVMMTLFVQGAMVNALRVASRHAITGFAQPDESREDAICRSLAERTLGFVRCGETGTTLHVTPFDTFTAAARFDPWAPPGEGVPDDDPPIAAGTAGQVVVYSLSYQPPVWTPAAALLGQSAIATLRASTIVRNEPWDEAS